MHLHGDIFLAGLGCTVPPGYLSWVVYSKILASVSFFIIFFVVCMCVCCICICMLCVDVLCVHVCVL